MNPSNPKTAGPGEFVLIIHFRAKSTLIYFEEKGARDLGIELCVGCTSSPES